MLDMLEDTKEEIRSCKIGRALIVKILERQTIKYVVTSELKDLKCPVLYSFMTYDRFVTRVKRRVSLVERERLSLSENIFFSFSLIFIFYRHYRQY
jgi:hypothetical protein